MIEQKSVEYQFEKLSAENKRLKKENHFKTGWISLLSHDFKEAFSSILLLIEALESKSISEKDFFSLLPQIKQDSAKNLQSIIDTGKWIKTQSEGFKPILSEIYVVELFAILNQEFKEKLQNKKLSFRFKGDETIKINADRLLILFILKKVVENAIKFSHVDNDIIFEASEGKNKTKLSIVDQGIGMSREHLENIFNFESARFQGTLGEVGAGLSLKIVRNFVYLMDGKIEIESSQNEGTTVSILLPRI